MKESFEKGDHIADKVMAQNGILSAGTISSRSDNGYWINCVAGGSTVIRFENAITVYDALDILKANQ